MVDQLRWYDRIISRTGDGGLMDSAASDPIEQERLAQLQEYQRREGRGDDEVSRPRKPSQSRRAPKKPPPKPKVATFADNLERTNKWLARTFPDLFGEEGPLKILDLNILRDIKQHYKSNQEGQSKKNQYPKNLVIKAALNRYLTADDYLLKLKAGAKRYNLKCQECGAVTKEEEDKAMQLLGMTVERR